ncbi:MAG: hypothetical protein A2033_08605 [Bacteroidetes bacterium GWA2_31_9]|nr:MAG: hypothetical protein A2033_08605 [Bacteroidetes bacterium GWA2_31_9]
MKIKYLIIALIVCLTQITNGQNIDKNLTEFISIKDSLLTVALNHRDTIAYKKQLNELEKVVEKLNLSEQEKSDKYLSNSYYNFACIYSLLNDKNNALKYLEKSKFYDYGHLLTDSDLDNIRYEARFIDFLNDAKKLTPDYIQILKNAKQYDFNDKREINKFTYKSENDSDLEQIRTYFKLDSVIGGGNEISKILNLLHWTHNTFPHNGMIEIPEYSNTFDMMKGQLSHHGTFDCGSLAMVLNTCYLSMGFKSRHVVCLPKDSTDMECHSINTVFSKTLDKWIWIDPTNDAYVMDEKGEFLSIEEVREYLINNKPLVLNPDANWNHVNSIIKEQYLYQYMAKNLYAFHCFAKGDGGSISNLLLPVEYEGIIPRIRSNNPKITNNPNVFWAKPE